MTERPNPPKEARAQAVKPTLSPVRKLTTIPLPMPVSLPNAALRPIRSRFPALGHFRALVL
jgi:hypothetical protein